MEPDKNYSALQASSATASAVAWQSHLLDVALLDGAHSLCHVLFEMCMPRRVCPCSGMPPFNPAEAGEPIQSLQLRSPIAQPTDCSSWPTN